MTVLLDEPSSVVPVPAPGLGAPAHRIPEARGPLSQAVVDVLTGRGTGPLPVGAIGDVAGDHHDGDVHAALWLLNVAQVADFDGVDPQRVSSLDLRTLHWDLERWFEGDLRRLVPAVRPQQLLDHVRGLIARPSVGGPDGDAAVERARFLAKAPYLGWEADPHTLALARVEAPLKPILVDIQSGEYGLGHADTHAVIYRRCLDALGTDLTTAVETAPASALAFANAAWLFGRDRRLRGAAVGQLALLELDSVAPCEQAKQRWDRAGLPAAGRRWYDVHALADVEHAAVVTEQLIPTLERETPWLVADAAWGAEVTWLLQDRVARTCIGPGGREMSSG